MKQLCAILALPLLAACATTAPDVGEDPPMRAAPEGECDATRAQAHLGERATAEVGQHLLGATGARSLRWIPPRSAVTMDYRMDRVNVEYDDSFTITRIHCG